MEDDWGHHTIEVGTSYPSFLHPLSSPVSLCVPLIGFRIQIRVERCFRSVSVSDSNITGQKDRIRKSMSLYTKGVGSRVILLLLC